MKKFFKLIKNTFKHITHQISKLLSKKYRKKYGFLFFKVLIYFFFSTLSLFITLEFYTKVSINAPTIIEVVTISLIISVFFDSIYLTYDYQKYKNKKIIKNLIKTTESLFAHATLYVTLLLQLTDSLSNRPHSIEEDILSWKILCFSLGISFLSFQIINFFTNQLNSIELDNVDIE